MIEDWFSSIEDFCVKQEIKHKIKITINYFTRISEDMTAQPRNKEEKELENLITDAMFKAFEEMELNPIEYLAMTPYLRQQAAKSIVKVLKQYNVDDLYKEFTDGNSN